MNACKALAKRSNIVYQTPEICSSKCFICVKQCFWTFPKTLRHKFSYFCSSSDAFRLGQTVKRCCKANLKCRTNKYYMFRIFWSLQSKDVSVLVTLIICNVGTNWSYFHLPDMTQEKTSQSSSNHFSSKQQFQEIQTEVLTWVTLHRIVFISRKRVTGLPHLHCGTTWSSLLARKEWCKCLH